MHDRRPSRRGTAPARRASARRRRRLPHRESGVRRRSSQPLLERLSCQIRPHVRGREEVPGAGRVADGYRRRGAVTTLPSKTTAPSAPQVTTAVSTVSPSASAAASASRAPVNRNASERLTTSAPAQPPQAGVPRSARPRGRRIRHRASSPVELRRARRGRRRRPADQRGDGRAIDLRGRLVRRERALVSDREDGGYRRPRDGDPGAEDVLQLQPLADEPAGEVGAERRDDCERSPRRASPIAVIAAPPGSRAARARTAPRLGRAAPPGPRRSDPERPSPHKRRRRSAQAPCEALVPLDVLREDPPRDVTDGTSGWSASARGELPRAPERGPDRRPLDVLDRLDQRPRMGGNVSTAVGIAPARPTIHGTSTTARSSRNGRLLRFAVSRIRTRSSLPEIASTTAIASAS